MTEEPKWTYAGVLVFLVMVVVIMVSSIGDYLSISTLSLLNLAFAVYSLVFILAYVRNKKQRVNR